MKKVKSKRKAKNKEEELFHKTKEYLPSVGIFLIIILISWWFLSPKEGELGKWCYLGSSLLHETITIRRNSNGDYELHKKFDDGTERTRSLKKAENGVFKARWGDTYKIVPVENNLGKFTVLEIDESGEHGNRGTAIPFEHSIPLSGKDGEC